MRLVLPPVSKEALNERVQKLAGLSLSQCAIKLGVSLPKTQTQQKGFIGQMMELALGATACVKPLPDFEHLGIELKTIPIGVNGRPSESTFVAKIALKKIITETWDTSVVKAKLSHVLWLPIEGIKDIPLAQRRIGQAFFWQPNEKEAQLLKQDWCELTDMIAMGRLEEITSSMGEVLQIRPKAADGKVLSDFIDSEGNSAKTLPRGFYLRSAFTQQILQNMSNHLACDEAAAKL